MIEIKNLTKRYTKSMLPALDDVSFKVRNRKIYGLLGPKGAGVSTVMDIIAGVTSPTQGTVLINGYDMTKQPKEAKQQIDYLPSPPALFPDASPREYLSFVAEAKGVKGEFRDAQVKEAIALTGLISVQDRLIHGLSKYYQKRIGLAATLLGTPDVILLDEPFTGSDARTVNKMRELIRRLGQTKTVIISGHVFAELSDLCDQLVILSEGRVVFEGAPQDSSISELALGEVFAKISQQATEIPSADYEDDFSEADDEKSDEPSPEEAAETENESKEAE